MEATVQYIQTQPLVSFTPPANHVRQCREHAKVHAFHWLALAPSIQCHDHGSKSTSSQAQPSLRRRMQRHMLDCAPSLSSLNSFASAELEMLPQITHRAREESEGEGQEDQEEGGGNPETEYESRTSSDEEDEDETPPQEVTPAVTGTTRPEKGKEKISPSPGRHSAPSSTRSDCTLLPSFKAPRE